MRKRNLFCLSIFLLIHLILFSQSNVSQHRNAEQDEDAIEINSKWDEEAIKILDDHIAYLLQGQVDWKVSRQVEKLLVLKVYGLKEGDNFFDVAMQDMQKAIGMAMELYKKSEASDALIYLENEEYDKAIAYYSRVINDGGKFYVMADAYLYRGFALRKLGKPELAIKDFNKGIEYFYNLPHFYFERGKAYLILNKIEEAIADYNFVLAHFNENGDATATDSIMYYNAHYDRGDCYFTQKDYNNAIRDLEIAYVFYPNNIDILVSLSYSWAMINSPRKSIDYLDKLFDLDSKNENGLAVLNKLITNSYEETVRIFEEITFSGDSEMFLDLARFYADSIPKTAVALCGISIAVDPLNQKAFSLRGYCNFKMQKFHEAIQDFTDAIEFHEDEQVLLSLRGKSFFSIGKYQDALNDFNHILKDSFSAIEYLDNYNLYELRADCLYLTKDILSAIREYSQLLFVRKESKIYAKRGNAYLEINKRRKACSDFRKSLRFGYSEAKQFKEMYCRCIYCWF